jgi:hypothetical protein
MATLTVEDFEDGDTTISAPGWSGWNGSPDLNATDESSTDPAPISGSFSGDLEAGGTNKTVTATRTSVAELQLDLTVRVDDQTGNANDYARIGYRDTGAGVTRWVRFRGDGTITTSFGVAVSATWTAGTAVDVTFRPDFGSGAVAVDIDGVTQGTGDGTATLNGLDEIVVDVDSSASGLSQTTVFDDLVTTDSPLATPTLSIGTVTGTAVDVSSTLPTDADAVDVYAAEASGVGTGDTLVGTITSGGGAVTYDALENGERYYFVGVARDTTSGRPDSPLSSEVDATTDLPAPSGVSTSATSQTAIDVSWTTNDNSTDGDIEVLVDGGVAAVVSRTATSHQVTGLSEATSYDIEISRVTPHATATSPTDTQYTKPAAPGAPTVTALDGDDLTASWSDNSTSETGYQRVTSTDGGQTYSVVGSDLAADTTSATWGDLSRPNTHTLVVRAVAGSGDAQATSQSPDGDSRYLAPSRAPTDAATWKLELTHPNGTAVMVEPTDATFYPRIKALPTLQATLPPDPRWTSGAFVDQSMKAWKNGQRLPIDTCVAIRDDSGGEITLQARGGSELRREANLVVSQKAVHDTVRDLGNNKTGYVMNVDDPDAETTTDTRIQSADTLAEWQAIDQDTPADVPLYYPGGGGLLRPAQTCFLGVNDGGTMGAPSGSFTEESDGTLTDNNWEDADVIRLDSQGDTVEWTFDMNYDIPDDRVGVAWRWEYDADGSQIPFYVQLDGITVFDSNLAGGLSTIQYTQDFGDQFGISLSEANNAHTLTIGIDGPVAADAYVRIDVGAVFDTDYHTLSNFPNQIITDASEPGYLYLPGPAAAADEVSVTTTDAIPPVSASGARVEIDVGSTYGAKRIELSGDQGQTYPISATDTESVEGDFGSLVGQVRSRITLGAQGEGQSDTPVDGYARPELLSYDVFADLDDTALFISENFQGSVLDVLQRGLRRRHLGSPMGRRRRLAKPGVDAPGTAAGDRRRVALRLRVGRDRRRAVRPDPRHGAVDPGRRRGHHGRPRHGRPARKQPAQARFRDRRSRWHAVRRRARLHGRLRSRDADDAVEREYHGRRRARGLVLVATARECRPRGGVESVYRAEGRAPGPLVGSGVRNRRPPDPRCDR